MPVQATLQAEAAAEQDKIIKQSADIAQQSIVTQQARFDAEMGIMKNRLAHENVSQSESCACCCTAVQSCGSTDLACKLEWKYMWAIVYRVAHVLSMLSSDWGGVAQAMSAQRQQDSAAMVESLSTELAERNTVIVHLEGELQQKEHLLQQISVAAAPAAAALPVAPSPNRPMPNKMARMPRHTPQRLVETPKSMLYPPQQALVSMETLFRKSTDEQGPSNLA